MSKSINFLIKLVYNNYSGKICEDDGSSIIVIKKGTWLNRTGVVG